MKRYFKFGTHCDNVLDLIVAALNLNLTIYQKGPKGNIQILDHTTGATAKETHLKFTCDPSNVAHNCYEAILLLDEPTQRHTEEKLTIESAHPSRPHLEQARSWDDAYDVIDLTDDSKITTSEQLDSLQNNKSDKELQFPMHLFVKTAAEWVDGLPHDIDGFKVYKIKCSPQKWVQKSHNLCYFTVSTLRRKDLIGMRKVGRCIWSLYCVCDDFPFKHSAEGRLNTMNFQNVGGHKVCFTCGNIASRKWWGVHKMTENCRESGALTVYHIGVHKCLLKKDTNIYRKQVRDAVLRNWGIGAQDIWEAWRRAMWLSCTNIRSEKAKISWKRNSDKHSLEAVGILKQAMDKEDKYLIYKIINPQFNGQPDYIFKSSALMAQLAIYMDQDGPEHPLQGEEVYSDGCHSRCVGYKTLALFVYHTAMCHILRLATMEVTSKSTHEITIFGELFNEILSNIKGRDYKFNPRAIMVDEKVLTIVP